MIGFGSYETPYLEGLDFIKDALKITADVDADKVAEDWKAIKDSDGYADGVGELNKVVNKDILGPASDRVDKAATAVKSVTPNRISIIARSKNSVLLFPVYITQTIRVNEAHIIAGLFDRVYAARMQTILSQNPIIDEKEANNLLFLKRFHTNINESADLVLYNEFYTPIDEVDQMLKESVFYREQITPTMEVTFRAIPCTDPHIILEHKRNQYEPLAKLSYLHEAANDKKSDKDGSENTAPTNVQKRSDSQTVLLTNHDLEEMAMDKAEISPSDRKLLGMDAKDIRQNTFDDMRGKDPHAKTDAIMDEVSKRIKRRDAAEKKFEKTLKNLKADIKADKLRLYKYDDGKYYRIMTRNATTSTYSSNKQPNAVDTSVDAPRILKDSEIKKINGMLPWTIEASFIIKGENGNLDRVVHYIIGVKANLHLIRAQDLSEDLREIINGNVKSLQKVRYKTGEITFIDYLFNKKGLRADAAKSINYNKRWLHNLKRLANWNNTFGHSLIGAPKKLISGESSIPIPNATMVLSQTDVTTMMNETGIDLSIASNAARLARSLFLIAVCIVDSSAGTMRVLFPDDSSDWDVQSLAALDAEVSKSDNSQIMKEINRAINRIN